MMIRQTNIAAAPLWIYHIMALATCLVWAMTFVSTKVIIFAGLNPTEIFIFRFSIAYVAMLTVSHRRFFSDSWRDEGLMALAGITGGSIFYIAQNTALELTFASDVSLLICTSPIFTMLLQKAVDGTPLKKQMMTGSVIALVGVGLVVMNGSLAFGSGPAGDMLTLFASLLWAFYCLVLQRLVKRYPTLMITRKVFFYGVVTALPVALLTGTEFHFSALASPEIAGNLLFLGILASMVCYILWNSAVRALGPARTSTYIYLQPLITIIASVLLLGEPLTVYVIVGCILILGGVYMAER